MSIQFVYGTSGTGKTNYLFNDVQQKLKENSGYKIKIVTPEQFSFNAEMELLKTSPSNSVVNAEVITFNRMAYRVLNEVGGITKLRLSKQGRAMLVSHILLNNKDNFSFLGNSDENVELMTRQLTELKKHQILPENLSNVADNTENEYLKLKLKDVSNLYNLYTKTIENKYIDENDNLTILSQKLDKSKEFSNCDIYIDEFVGFTKQEYEILRKLMQISHKITITICADNLNENTNPDIDVFYANKQTVHKIMEIAKEQNVTIEKPICLNEVKRFKNAQLQHLAKNMSMPFYEKYLEDAGNISIFLASNPYSEIEEVAIKIAKLVKRWIPL